MASKHQQVKDRTLEQVAADVGLYPLEAYEFIQQGLSFTVHQIHGGDEPKRRRGASNRHVTGQDLCEGLRLFALAQWGFLARTVLRRWNVTSTHDFGRIVFALIDAGQMQKTDEDTLDDFQNVYDFRTSLECGYQIDLASETK